MAYVITKDNRVKVIEHVSQTKSPWSAVITFRDIEIPVEMTIKTGNNVRLPVGCVRECGKTGVVLPPLAVSWLEAEAEKIIDSTK
jgi:hypothetical protein